MHHPPTARVPSLRELYGRGFHAMVACWSAACVLLVLTAGARAVTVLVADIVWFGGDPAWSEAARLLSDTLGTVSLGLLPVLLVPALVLTVSSEVVQPHLLPPWTTGERLRTARILSRNAVMGDDPRTNLLARVYADLHVRGSGWMLYRSALTACLLLNGLMSGTGVFLLVRGTRNEDPALMAIGLATVLLFAGFAVAALVLVPRRRRMREFRDLYDAAHREAGR